MPVEMNLNILSVKDDLYHNRAKVIINGNYFLNNRASHHKLCKLLFSTSKLLLVKKKNITKKRTGKKIEEAESNPVQFKL